MLGISRPGPRRGHALHLGLGALSATADLRRTFVEESASSFALSIGGRRHRRPHRARGAAPGGRGAAALPRAARPHPLRVPSLRQHPGHLPPEHPHPLAADRRRGLHPGGPLRAGGCALGPGRARARALGARAARPRVRRACCTTSARSRSSSRSRAAPRCSRPRPTSAASRPTRWRSSARPVSSTAAARILEHQTTPYRQVRELGEEIPLTSRIIKVVNAYEDLTVGRAAHGPASAPSNGSTSASATSTTRASSTRCSRRSATGQPRPERAVTPPRHPLGGGRGRAIMATSGNPRRENEHAGQTPGAVPPVRAPALIVFCERGASSMSALPITRLFDPSDPVFRVHEGGKLGVHATSALRDADDLSLLYTPGVAQVSRAIAADPALATVYTAVATRSPSSATAPRSSDWGTWGHSAAMPVMEGKAVLFKHFADVDAVPVCMETGSVEEIVDAVARIAPTYGGINLEDISAPRCFEIERRLQAASRHPGLPRRPARDGDRGARCPAGRRAGRRQGPRGPHASWCRGRGLPASR